MLSNLLLDIPEWFFNALQYGDDLLAVVGSVMLGMGIAGHRAGWGPRCRKCGFDLRGVTEGSPACPECGASLKPRRAIKYGVRARRWGLISAGAAVLLVATASTVMQLPSLAFYWHEQLRAETFDVEKLIDQTLAGNARATSDLQADMNGSGQRMRRRPTISPGQDTVLAILDRMEKDPASRKVLLPLVLSPTSQAFMWSRESSQPVRMARLLVDVAEHDATLFDSLNFAALNSLFQRGNSPATAQLLASPQMIARLYRGGGPPEARVSDGALTVTFGASFGGSTQPLWLHNLPIGLRIADAQWRAQGQPDSEWRDADRVEPGGMSASAVVTVNSVPATGVVELRVRGAVIQGPDAGVWRRQIGKDLRTVPGEEAAAQPTPVSAVPFEWTQSFALKPRSELVLTPASTAGIGQWVDETLKRTSLIADPSAPKGKYLLLVELHGSINSAEIALNWTLQQDGKTWEGSEAHSNDNADQAFDAPEFDPNKPFTVSAHADTKRLRERATADCTYLDLNRALQFDALTRPPRSMSELPRAAQDSPR